jgi:hypothetical protein
MLAAWRAKTRHSGFARHDFIIPGANSVLWSTCKTCRRQIFGSKQSVTTGVERKGQAMRKADGCAILRTGILVSTITMFSITAAPSAAHEVAPRAQASEPATLQRSAAASTLNLLSEPRDRVPVIRARAIVTGSWVCSPAGFGRRSRCYRH